MRELTITGTRTFPLDDGSLLLEMSTDAGIVGYGQPLSYGHRRLVMAAVEELTGYLIGRDPFRIEDHWQVLYRSSYARAMPILVGALSGLEMAMWDIAGKALDEPVWRLLGGPTRDRVRVYAGCSDAARARELVDQGLHGAEDGFGAQAVALPGAAGRHGADRARGRRGPGRGRRRRRHRHRPAPPAEPGDVTRAAERAPAVPACCSPRSPATGRTWRRCWG